MPLYTVRTNLTLDPHTSRGDNTASMSHHFEWPDDASAVADFTNLVEEFQDSDIGDCWTCARGAATHEMILYRRSIENERSFDRLQTLYFHLDEFTSVDIGIEIGGVPADVEFTQTPLFHNRRAAVLVLQVGFDERVKKRTYIGPCSPIYLAAHLELLVSSTEMIGLINPGTLDDPPQLDDRTDRWRLTMAERARDHVRNLANDFDNGGVPVVISWKFGVKSFIESTQAQLAVADLRSRGIRAGFTDPV